MLQEYLNEDFVKEQTTDVIDIKGFTVYFLRIDIYQGLCCLVFKNGRQITQEVALNYKPYDKEIPCDEKLRKMYIKSMKNKLFTEKELQTVKDYSDYENKSYFLNNYYCKQVDYLSWFGIEVAKGKYDMNCDSEKLKKKYTINNVVGFCYNLATDQEFVNHMFELQSGLTKARMKNEESDEYMLQAFEYEMDNHEYAINWQGDWDVCSCFGNCTYGSEKDYTDYLKEIGKEKLIPIYAKARANHMKRAANW